MDHVTMFRQNDIITMLIKTIMKAYICRISQFCFSRN